MKHSIIESTLTTENIRFYHENGFLVANDVVSEEKLNELIAEASAIVSGRRGPVEGVLDLEGDETEDEVLRKYAAIHFPHKISDVMKQTAAHPTVADYLSKTVSENVKCLQTMLFMKAPGKKGQSWHQDEFFIPTRDRSLTGVWLALEDADVGNGCLWVIPGSQREGFIRKRIANTNANFADVDVADIRPYTEGDFLPVPVKKGSVIIFNGYLLHMSLQNKTEDRFRRALVSHYCSAESMLPWDQDGRQEPTQDFRDIFMVSGKDPYSYKGIQDLSKPFVRPDVLDFGTDAFRKRIKSEQKDL